MLAYSQDRKRRYTEKVFSKITKEQDDWLQRQSNRRNVPVSELVRDAIQAAIDDAGRTAGKTGSEDINVLSELVQSMRSEALSAFSCLGVDLKNVSGEAEAVAAAELSKFKERRERRADLVRALGASE